MRTIDAELETRAQRLEAGVPFLKRVEFHRRWLAFREDRHKAVRFLDAAECRMARTAQTGLPGQTTTQSRPVAEMAGPKVRHCPKCVARGDPPGVPRVIDKDSVPAGFCPNCWIRFGRAMPLD